MLLQVTLARGSCQLEAEQLLIPLVMSHSKVDPWSWPVSPCGAERGRQHRRGQTYSTLRSWIYENKERGKTKATLASTLNCYLKRPIDKKKKKKVSRSSEK